VLAQLAQHAELLRRHRGGDVGASSLLQIPAGEERFLDEATSLAALQHVGLPVVPFRLCRCGDAAADAFRSLGPRVVVKGCAAQFPHKSEHGLVRLNVTSPEDARAAFAQISASLESLGVTRPEVVIASMIGGGREMLLGAKVDPIFGPVLTVGDGGKWVEVMDDVAVLVAPVSVSDVRDALERLRVAPILRGVRGESPLDLDAFCDAAVRLIESLDARSNVVSIDANPVMLGRVGEGVTIVDAVIERRNGRAEVHSH
jgi:acetate---CoA ligase (ADP-forming)